MIQPKPQPDSEFLDAISTVYRSTIDFRAMRDHRKKISTETDPRLIPVLMAVRDIVGIRKDMGEGQRWLEIVCEKFLSASTETNGAKLKELLTELAAAAVMWKVEIDNPQGE